MNKVVAGIDLHSNNLVIGIMDMDGKRLANRKLPCELREVVKFLTPFKKRLQNVAVESTYNWYWLVDGLQLAGYPVVLRPVRDLLRRRLMLVHQRTALMLSFKSLYTRTFGKEMKLSQLKELEVK